MDAMDIMNQAYQHGKTYREAHMNEPIRFGEVLEKIVREEFDKQNLSPSRWHPYHKYWIQGYQQVGDTLFPPRTVHHVSPAETLQQVREELQKIGWDVPL